MSINNAKKGHLYSSLLSDLKDSRNNPKTKTQKMYIQNLSNGVHNIKDEGIKAFNNEKSSSAKISQMDNHRIIEKRKQLSSSNIEVADPNLSNKIDIKISVNYKPHIAENKSKSFYHNANSRPLMSQTPQPQSTKHSGYLQTYNEVCADPGMLRDKMAKSLIRNIKDEGIRKSNSIVDKRNQSELYHNSSNFNISFNNYENKQQVQNIYTTSKIPTNNNSFNYIPDRLVNRNTKGPNDTYLDNIKSSKYVLNLALLDSKTEDLRDKGEFTFKRDDKEFLYLTNNSIAQNRNLAAQFSSLETKLEGLFAVGSQEDNNYSLNTFNKKHIIYRKILDEVIKLCPDYSQKLLGKLFDGYNDIIKSLLVTANTLTEKANETDLYITSK
jgi:hypothetical protein